MNSRFTTSTGMTFTMYDIKSPEMEQLLPDGSISQEWGFFSPPDTKYYFGARAIYILGNGADLLHDRKCFKDENGEISKLINAHKFVAGTVDEALEWFQVATDDDHRYHGVSEDGKLECIFTCNGSCGYIYITFFTRN